MIALQQAILLQKTKAALALVAKSADEIAAF
jgi:hypothetical protein